MPAPKRRRSLKAADARSAIGALPPLAELDDSDSRESPPAHLAHSHIFFWITQVMGRRDRLLTREFRPFNVRVAEWRVLLAITVQPGISMSEVADYASIDPTTLSRTVDQMLRAHWLIRTPDPRDMRVTRLTLTPEGIALFNELWPIADNVNRLACEGLPDGAAQLMCLGLSEIQRGLARAATAVEADADAEPATAK